MKNRKRIGALLAFGLLCLLLLLLGRPSRSTVATQPAAPEPAPPPSPGSFTHHHPAPALEDPPALPVIAAMSVENREVCSGQDNMATARLAGAYANDPSIRILMPAASAAGPQMRFSLFLWGGQLSEMPVVSVYGSRGVLATVKIPTVSVKDCTPEPSLSVGVSLEPNTSATYTFTATIRNPRNTPIQAVEWQWDFGDGTDGTTHVRTVEHGYEDRPQKTRMSSFLVHVRAVDAQGMELVGRTGLELRNPAFEATRALLKQDVVTQDVSDRLQREGAFEHLAEEVAMNDDQPSPGAEQQGAAPAKLPRGSTMGRAHPAGRLTLYHRHDGGGTALTGRSRVA